MKTDKGEANTDMSVIPLKPAGKMETARRNKLEAIRVSCEAGIGAVLSHPIATVALELLDEISVALMDYEFGDPANTIRTQVLRSAGSVAANIAEGIGKAYEDDKRRFFLQARGSAYETVIWLRALARHDLFNRYIDLCNAIDAAILAELTQ